MLSNRAEILIEYDCRFNKTLCFTGKVFYQGCTQVHGTRVKAQVQLHQPKMLGHKGDGVPASTRVLHETQPLLSCKRQRQCHGGDDTFPRLVS